MNFEEFEELQHQESKDIICWVKGGGPYAVYQVVETGIDDDIMWAEFNDGSRLPLNNEALGNFVTLESIKLRPTNHHKLKILPHFYKEVIAGTKTFEIRKNDRDFREGDTVTLIETVNGMPTGKFTTCKVGYVTEFQQQEGYVVFSIHPLKETNAIQTNP